MKPSEVKLNDEQFNRIVAAVKQSFRISVLEVANVLPDDDLANSFEDVVYDFLAERTEEV